MIRMILIFFIRAYGDEFFQKYDINKKEEIICFLESRIFDKSIIKNNYAKIL